MLYIVYLSPLSLLKEKMSGLWVPVGQLCNSGVHPHELHALQRGSLFSRMRVLRHAEGCRRIASHPATAGCRTACPSRLDTTSLVGQIIHILTRRYEMLKMISTVQIQPRKHALDNADYTAPTPTRETYCRYNIQIIQISDPTTLKYRDHRRRNGILISDQSEVRSTPTEIQFLLISINPRSFASFSPERGCRRGMYATDRYCRTITTGLVPNLMPYPILSSQY